ncbi:hypothetical protein DFP72DRAFT_828379 [Ephemerocybe angulata]|uniref:Uncharacterized protein n=1 Tax=Ephemerocybe angulata TaxID=980116 RepID=A0A8H6HA35_9AGAR|nr:hypothetical protein DFP72DRAFT_828379 [Tulosesus angulatus]
MSVQAPVHAQAATRVPRTLPIPGVFIPNLPAGSSAWREAVRQWEEGAENLLPLCDWPPAWYSGGMRTVFRTKRGDRKTGLSSSHFPAHRDEDTFLRLYPEASKGFRALLTAIQARSPTHVCRHRTSKHGSPEERDSACSRASSP